MSVVLHIQILLHAVQPEPAEPFLTAHLEHSSPRNQNLAAQSEPFLAVQPEPFLTAQPESFHAAQPEPFLAVHLEPQNPKPSRAVQSRTRTFLAPRHPERSRL